MINFRFSGHETFPCRYGWLPKAARAIDANPELFANEDDAMVILGIGKNMVRALRFWVEVTGIAQVAADGRGLAVTDFGQALLLGKDAFDPYIEDLQTLWLIHWKLVTQPNPPLFAWDFLFNRWHSPQIIPSEIVQEFTQESLKLNKSLSQVTLKQHFDVFIHTYTTTRGHTGAVMEDNLDSPLTELRLIQVDGSVGEQSRERGSETAFSFRRDKKPEIGTQLFLFCVMEFWQNCYPNEETLSVDQVAYGHGGPGQVFKLPDNEIRDRMADIELHSKGRLVFKESVQTQQIVRRGPILQIASLKSIYESGAI